MILLSRPFKEKIIKSNRFSTNKIGKENYLIRTFDGLSNSIIESNKTVGVWGPISNSSHTLEELRGINQSRAISEIITQGFDEYYFVMSDFKDPKLNGFNRIIITVN